MKTEEIIKENEEKLRVLDEELSACIQAKMIAEEIIDEYTEKLKSSEIKHKKIQANVKSLLDKKAKLQTKTSKLIAELTKERKESEELVSNADYSLF